MVKFFSSLKKKNSTSLNLFENFDISKLIKQTKPDLVHLHWIGNEMMSMKQISKINKPLVWTMLDMWPFTGCEHYTFDKRFISGYNSNNRPNFENGLSVCSGGEYPNLVSSFKGTSAPGVGISFGVTRLTSVMSEINQFKVNEKKPVLVCVLSNEYLPKYYEILEELRSNNINSEIYLDSKKNLGKQLTYANKRGLPLAVICGENEFKDNKITIKNLLGKKEDNNQITFSKENLIDEIRKITPKDN